MVDHCHYCMRAVFGPDHASDPMAIKTRDHKVPRGLTKGKMVILCSCWECNSIKNATPYEVFTAYIGENLHRYKTHNVGTNRLHYQQYCFDLMLAGLKGKTK